MKRTRTHADAPPGRSKQKQPRKADATEYSSEEIDVSSVDAAEDEDDDDEGEDPPTQKRRQRLSQSQRQDADDSDGMDEFEGTLDFTQPDYAMPASQPSGSQDSESTKAKAPTMPAKVGQLSAKKIDELTAQLVRYMLYKAGLKLPIRFSDISKEVFPKHKNVSRYFFQKAKQQLENVFGYQVVAVDDSSSKEIYIILNGASAQEHLLQVNKNGRSSTRGLLMLILGILWCAPARQLSEDDLWKQLARVDSTIKPNKDHRQLGDVAQLLKTFENQMYLNAFSELDVDLKKVKFYNYGPRTLIEVGKVQILNFVCKAIAALYGSDSSDSDDARMTASSDIRRADFGHATETSIVNGSINGDNMEDSNSDENRHASPPSSTRKRPREEASRSQWRRSFAHVDGNWPSHVKIDIPLADDVVSLVNRVVDDAQRIVGDHLTLVPLINDNAVDDGDGGLHMSLSRPFVLTYEQIDAFVETLKTALKWRTRFHVSLERATVLVNDDSTRSFLTLQVGKDASKFVSLLKCVDNCMREFGLATYYEDPIPHVSIASALGGLLRGALSPAQLDQLLPQTNAGDETCAVVHVASVQVVVGNKRFRIRLR